ncbi:FecCD family ABC transporter permease [Natronobacterium gregoryi]|uniref:Cobalamin import system permease protein BtuC n=2 Tax=Natronobacterium gregoryi TaxID=44930 RepID=L0AFK2_NATGS|nr:iron ABC transporter permease [Natronobacterium gregoryi]AFZ72214.1 ABC-type Fe3+-siderophore transport system, permease component [Natronobacterium gregoryi SP2]ELY62386.1 transport system permease [Natronobacterium gregoryi SP2]PLK20164.1 iron ABC transporter permease [Natronobacterium gregoryi SP2]SFJ28237.1 iron complex transport system permease protein [Natronobacterium gregoryi]
MERDSSGRRDDAVTGTVRSTYEQFVGRKLLFTVVCGVLLVVTFLASLAIGPVRLPLTDVLAGLLGNADATTQTIVWNVRLPQALAAIVAGGGLAVAGTAMQNVLRNPLGSPFTLGISQAAAFGAAFAIVFLGVGGTTGGSDASIVVDNPYLVTFSAFVWSLVSTGVILALVKYARASPETLILSGVALGSMFTASLSLVQYFAQDVEVAAIVYWTFGDVGRATWSDLAVMVLATAAGTAYFVYNGWSYTALNAGDETATSLGVNVEQLRIRGMIVASLVTAFVISFVGIIGFVGLVVPHIVRKVIGGDERFLLPASVLAGGVLLLASDTVARTIIAPVVLPVGILTSFLGAPLFLYLVIARRDYW